MELLSLIFSFFSAGMWLLPFKTNRRLTTTNNKHKYRKQSEMKSQNQESGSKTRGFDLSSTVQVQAVDRLLDFAVASRVPLDDW